MASAEGAKEGATPDEPSEVPPDAYDPSFDRRTWTEGGQPAVGNDDLVAYRHRFCGGRVHLTANECEVRAICSECGDTDGLDLEAVVVAERSEAPSPVLYDELREAVAGIIASMCAEDCFTVADAVLAVATKWPCSPAPIPKEDR